MGFSEELLAVLCWARGQIGAEPLLPEAGWAPAVMGTGSGTQFPATNVQGLFRGKVRVKHTRELV